MKLTGVCLMKQAIEVAGAIILRSAPQVRKKSLVLEPPLFSLSHSPSSCSFCSCSCSCSSLLVLLLLLSLLLLLPLLCVPLQLSSSSFFFVSAPPRLLLPRSPDVIFNCLDSLRERRVEQSLWVCWGYHIPHPDTGNKLPQCRRSVYSVRI